MEHDEMEKRNFEQNQNFLVLNNKECFLLVDF